VADQSYFDYVQEHIFDVAGMANSGFYHRDDEARNIARGYTAMHSSMPGGMPGSRSAVDREVDLSMSANANARQDNRSYMSSKGGPAGGAYSTVEEMLKFSLNKVRHAVINSM
jgi:CubicO group peptidase (beta-lactamase class C family)